MNNKNNPPTPSRKALSAFQWLFTSCAVTLAFANTAAAACHNYGALASDPSRSAQMIQSGVGLATLEIAWDAYEPTEGAFSISYRDQTRAKIQSFQSAGVSIVLDLGLQYPPSWIFSYSHSRFKNQYGTSFADPGPGWNGVNAVFNQTMRVKQENYIQRVMADLGASNFHSVRLGWGWFGELNYPPASYAGQNNCYWAFDALAQGTASGRPTGVNACPVPGWIPGTPSANHASASQFANWYLDSLKNYHDWQITTIRKYFAGPTPMLYPGWGIRPGQLTGAINVDLNGTTSVEINGELQRGSDYQRFVAGITDSKVVVYTTWLDTIYGNDASSVQSDWTPVHYLSYLAGLNSVQPAVSGENTGDGDLAAMQRCFSRMNTYNLTGFMWAWENQLFSGGYATLADYSNLIAQNGGSCITPPSGIVSGAIYRLTPKLTLSKAMEAKNGGTADGTQVQIWTWAGSNKQKWKITDVGGGYYKLVPQHATTKALDVSSSGTADGTKIQIWGDNGTGAQRWKIIDMGGGYSKLQPECAPSSCLDLKYSGTANGTIVHLWGDNGTDAQRWKLEKQ